VAFQERLLAAGGKDAVHRLARVRQPEREQRAGDLLAAQPHGHVAEVDLGLGAGPVRLRHERRWRPVACLDADLRQALRDVGADHAVGDLVRVVLGDEPVEDALDGVPLLAWRVQVGPQDLVDPRLVGVQPARPGRQRLARLGPRRRQRLGDGAPAHPVLALQGTARQPGPRVTADRHVQLDPGPRHRRLPTRNGTGILSPSRPVVSKLTYTTFRPQGAVPPPANKRGHFSSTEPAPPVSGAGGLDQSRR
jgi:hypothetical protein